MQLQAAITHFLDRLAFERHYSPHTLENYARYLKELEFFLKQQGFLSVHDLSAAQLRTFLLEPKTSKRRHPKTLALIKSILKSFCRHLLRAKILTHDPASGLRSPKIPKHLPKLLEVDEAALLLNELPKEPLLIRDHAMLELFYSSGLRLFELATLRLNQLNLKEKQVRVIGKGQKTREVPVGQKAVVALHAWLLQRAAWHKGDDTVFISKFGTPLSPRAIEQRVALWAKRKGLKKHLHPHMLRHSFASHLLESSSDLRAVQEMLGHANLSSTQIYTNLDFQHLADVYDKAHPRARMRGK